MESKIDTKPLKFRLQGLSWSRRFLAIWWRFLTKLRRRWSQDGRKMGQVGSKLCPKMGHDSQDDHVGVSLGVFGKVLQAFLITFLRSLEKWPKCKKEEHYGTLGGFLGVGASSGGSWRLSWERFGGYVGRCWLQDGVFLAILGDVWTSWRQGWRTRAQDAADGRKSWIFGGLEGGGGDAILATDLGYPPLRNSKGRGWSSHLHLELSTPPGNS